MYLSHYNLKEKPFQITADPRFLWLGEKHQEALSMLKYSVLDGKGFLLLTGDVGTGKTTLINALLKSVDDDVIVATVPDPSLGTLEFFEVLARAFKIDGRFTTKVDFLTAFEAFLNEAHVNDKQVLLIVDEAQRLSRELLEEIRLLSNIEKEDSKLLNIFFVGQDEFKDIIEAEECRALRQRIATTYHIKSLTQGETAEYVKHRLTVAGGVGEIFSQGAVEEIYSFSKGYPRLINIICDHALLTGYVRDLARLDRAVIQECSKELSIHVQKSPGQDVLDPGEPAADWKRLVLYTPLAFALCFCGYLVLVVGYADTVQNVKRYYGDLIGRAPSTSLTSPDSAKPTVPGHVLLEADRHQPEAVAADKRSEETEGTALPGSVIGVAEKTNFKDSLDSKDQNLIITFDNETAAFPQGVFRVLDHLVARMGEEPEMQILLKGYSDILEDTNARKYSKLSPKVIANRVKSYLVDEGVSPERIAVMGVADESPAMSGPESNSRALGPRVEIELLRAGEG